ncbi:hypothetical protein FKG94_23370 [Exilibacterium tricleocarpae]|uniref:Uncharacterized protein n=1 Tax=Exilibacterium tricleocarpae TaxID=2591008 RepID=A0A545STG0_9GAMM|nr:hypothetical protein [Exilibacterium tricleocarpae]TQV68241.1 hypothetical protein FKG94_23370 [Exilibacterium tricleocarpae]
MLSVLSSRACRRFFLAGSLAALVSWLHSDTMRLTHDHKHLSADHPHLLEGHPTGDFTHPFVIDDLHPQWPRSSHHGTDKD